MQKNTFTSIYVKNRFTFTFGLENRNNFTRLCAPPESREHTVFMTPPNQLYIYLIIPAEEKEAHS